jgi:hypothetical protein
MYEKEYSKAGPMAQLNLIIDNAVFQKINHWIQKAPGEVSGLGKITINGGTFRVVDAILVKQENGAASTDLDPASVAKAMYELKDTPGHLNFWWHSHVNMNVFWSGTDIDTIREIGQHGFVVSTVFNKRRELLSSFYVQSNGVLPELFINNFPTQIISYLNQDEVAEWDREYEEKCSSRIWTSHWNGKGTSQLDLVPTTGDPFQGKHENEGFVNRDSEANTDEETTSPDDYPVKELLEDMAEDMEFEPRYEEAKDLLTKICRAVTLDQTLTHNEKEELKQEYIQRFNQSRVDLSQH